jgi:hypothetical protein
LDVTGEKMACLNSKVGCMVESLFERASKKKSAWRFVKKRIRSELSVVEIEMRTPSIIEAPMLRC